MPSSEDCINAENEARRLAVDKIVEREKCSKDFAADYVSRLSREEIATLIGWPKPGAAYSPW